MAEPMPSTPTPAKGPLGEPRSWGTVALLSIVTCGIYFLYYQYKTFEELKQHNSTGIGGVVGLIIGIFVGIVNAFLLPSEIKQTYESDGRTAPFTAIIGLWWFLPIAGFFIWLYKVQNALNDYWTSKGAPARA